MAFDDHYPQIVSLLYNSVRDSSPREGRYIAGSCRVYCGCRGSSTMYSVRSRVRAGAGPGRRMQGKGGCGMRVAACQMNSRQDKADNLDTPRRPTDQAAEAGAYLAVLPEYLDYLGTDDGARDAA